MSTQPQFCVGSTRPAEKTQRCRRFPDTVSISRTIPHRESLNGLEGQGASKKYYEHHNLNQNVQGGNEGGRHWQKVRLNVPFICDKPDTRESLFQ